MYRATLDREEIMPLIAGAFVAVLLHLMLVPAVAVALLARSLDGQRAPSMQSHSAESDSTRSERTKQLDTAEPVEPEPPEVETKIKLGKDNAPERLTMAWIHHDDFQQLMNTEQSQTQQPALQESAEPVPQAPPRLEATDAAEATRPAPPVPLEPERPAPASTPVAALTTDGGRPNDGVPADQPQAEAPTSAEGQAAQQISATSPLLESTRSDAQIAEPLGDTLDLATANRVDASGPLPLETTPTNQVQAQQRVAQDEPGADQPETMEEPAPRVAAAPPAATTITDPAAPTSSAQSDRQSMPTTRIDMRKRRLGAVAVDKGLEIRPVAPKFGVVTRLSGIPSNAKATITFNKKGRAIRVRLDKSTGYAGYDSPILEALYKWRAHGSDLPKNEGNISIPITLILR